MFTQATLSYGYDALEPHIDALTMETHYSKHHAAYTNALNDASEKAGVSDKSIEELLSSLDSISDAALRNTIRNNGGGFYNHNLYFTTMSPNPSALGGALKDRVEKDFGSLDALKEELKKAATTRFGSGWAWLSAAKDGSLKVSSSPNQDNPIIEGAGVTPILGIDVWEHAYYLKYKNLRASYVDEFFNVVDWAKVAENYSKAIA